MKDEIVKYIPEKFKEKFNEIDEIHIKEITQETVDSVRKGLQGVMTDEMKLVGIKFQFLSKKGILCENGWKAEGFDEDEWNE